MAMRVGLDVFDSLREEGVNVKMAFLRSNDPTDFDLLIGVPEAEFLSNSIDFAYRVAAEVRRVSTLNPHRV